MQDAKSLYIAVAEPVGIQAKRAALRPLRNARNWQQGTSELTYPMVFAALRLNPMEQARG